MSRLNLVLHCGARSVDREQINQVQTPEATDTWHPIPHSTLLDMVVNQLPSYGLSVVQEAHGLFGNDGERMFSLMQISSEQDSEFGLVVGLRNSHDKSFPAGLCCGSGVFVCDNLAFSSEIVVGRRHTRFIMRDLPALVSGAMGQLMQARVKQEQRLECYHQAEIGDTEAKALIVDAFKAQAINIQRLPRVIQQWDTPDHPEFAAEGKTVWRLFNAFTEAYKPTNPNRPVLATLPSLTTKLHGLLDCAAGLVEGVEQPIEAQFADNPEVLIGRAR